jgi:hypothetical protein
MPASRAARPRTASFAFVIAALGLAFSPCVAADAAPAGQARTDFMLHCMGCHRADGTGTPPGIPALRNRVGYYLQIAGGREYLTQVPGAANAPLSDARLAGVLNWIIAEYAGPSAPAAWTPFTPGEVRQSRGTGPSDIDARRLQLWDDIAQIFPGQDATY